MYARRVPCIYTNLLHAMQNSEVLHIRMYLDVVLCHATMGGAKRVFRLISKLFCYCMGKAWKIVFPNASRF